MTKKDEGQALMDIALMLKDYKWAKEIYDKYYKKEPKKATIKAKLTFVNRKLVGYAPSPYGTIPVYKETYEVEEYEE